jgi:protein phosphatase/serine/threonine-protein phosphatase Stp1
MTEMERSVLSAGPFQSWAASHPGPVRPHNEDRFVNRPEAGLWAVADGAGGHEAGQLAAEAVKEALDAMPADLSATDALAEVRVRIAGVHTRLRVEAADRGGLVATTVVVLLARDGHFACLWAGDSRAYLLRAGVLTQLTRDHSLVREMVDVGAISAEEAEGHPRANVITRAVGAAVDEIELEKVTGELLPGDCLLLCSDGLTKTLTESEIVTLLVTEKDGPAERLILAALTRDTTDNVTVVMVVSKDTF